MGRNDGMDEVPITEELAEALRKYPEAELIWGRLPEAHRRGHVIAIRRISDPAVRTQRIQHTIEHLLKKHAS